MSTITVYPASGLSSPVDGVVIRDTVDEAFATIRAGAGNLSGDNITIGPDPVVGVALFSSSTPNQYSGLYRSILCFDTSSIPDNAAIQSATLSLWGHSKANGVGSPALHVCGSTPASTGTLVDADYSQVGSTSFGSVTYAGFATGVYNDISLNASGLAAISKTSITKFGLRLSWDILNSFTGSWVSSDASYLFCRSAEQGGTANDPKLTVTYVVYDTTKDTAQSVELNTANTAMIATVTLSPVESLPGTTSVDYAIQSDSGTGFAGVSKNVDTNLIVPALSGNASHKWRAELNGLASETPVLDSLSIAYRKAMPVVATADRLAQSFNSGAGDTVVMVILNLVKDVSDTIDYTVEIQTDSGGSPSGTVVTNGSTTIAASSVPNQASGGSFSWVSAIFGTPPVLSASTTYWVVLKVGTAGTSKLLWRARGGDSYASGTAKFSTNGGSSYTTMTNDDFLFQVLSSGGTFTADVLARYKRRYL